MSNLLYPQEAACLVRMLEACNLAADSVTIKMHFAGGREVTVSDNGQEAIVRLTRVQALVRYVRFETFPTLAAMKAAYAID